MNAPRQELEAPPEGFVLFNARGSAETFLGPYYWRILNGRPAMGFRVKSHHLNRHGVCHGGVISSFADAQIAVLKIGTDLDGHMTPTVNLTVDFIAPARLGTWIESAPMLLKATARLIFVTADIRADTDIVARTNGIFKIIGRTFEEVRGSPEAACPPSDK